MPASQRLVATGTSGFIGRGLAHAAQGNVEAVHLRGADWRERLSRIDWRAAVILHLAGRVHRPPGSDPAAYALDNVEKTQALARAAAAGGARRIVFLSTLKVNAEESGDRPIRADDTPRPEGDYASSKWEAERKLAAVAGGAGREVVTVRSPLVIGPAAQGNLAALLRLADSPWPLPFAGIDNRRTFIARDDLVALLLRCAHAPAAAGRTLLAGDPDAVSTPRLVRVLRAALGRPPRLFAAPPGLLEAAASAAGKGAHVRRLTRSLEADVSDTMRLLDWRPERPMDEALREMALAWKQVA